MADVNKVDLITNSIAGTLKTNTATRFTNSGDGYASSNGSLGTGERFNVMDIDETNQVVAQLSNDTYMCEITVPRTLGNSTIANKIVNAWNATKP